MAPFPPCASAVLAEAPSVPGAPLVLGGRSPPPLLSSIGRQGPPRLAAPSSLERRAIEASRRAPRTAAVAAPSRSSGSGMPGTETPVAAPYYLKDMSKEELQEWVADTLGEPPKRAHTLWKWLYRNGHWASCPDDMEGVGVAFRRRLTDSGASFDSLQHVGTHESSDGTKKVLFQLRDGTNGGQGLIETVLIPHASRSGKPLKRPPGAEAEHVPVAGSTGSTGRAASLEEVAASQGHAGGARLPGSELRGDSGGRDGGVLEASRTPPSGSTRYTICVSSQLGCAMNCQFCFTAKMGLRQHLTPGQIVDQVVQVRRLFTRELGQISNVVFMGMGEPLHNLEHVVRAVNTLTDDHGLHCSPHRTTVSTCGLVPEIREYRRRTRGSLAISLHATTDEVRDRIMPINRRYSISQLMECLAQEFGGEPRGKSHVLVEYLLLDGVNDSKEDAERLSRLTSTFPCKVNLIMFNRFPGAPFGPTPEDRAQEFQDTLVANGVKAFLRLSRGDDAMAACGQLGNQGLE